MKSDTLGVFQRFEKKAPTIWLALKNERNFKLYFFFKTASCDTPTNAIMHWLISGSSSYSVSRGCVRNCSLVGVPHRGSRHQYLFSENYQKLHSSQVHYPCYLNYESSIHSASVRMTKITSYLTPGIFRHFWVIVYVFYKIVRKHISECPAPGLPLPIISSFL